jgi:hypothetical protein
VEQIDSRSHIELHVVLRGFNAIHVFERQEDCPFTVADDQPGQRAVWIGDRIQDQGICRPLRRRSTHLTAIWLYRSHSEALPCDRFEQIIDGADLEGAYGVSVVRSDENHRRHAIGADGFDNIEAVHARHQRIGIRGLRPRRTDGEIADERDVGTRLLAKTSLKDTNYPGSARYVTPKGNTPVTRSKSSARTVLRQFFGVCAMVCFAIMNGLSSHF